MRRKLLFGAAFFFIAWAATSCEALNTCKICRQVIYEGTKVIDEGPEQEYCNADLAAIKAMKDVIIGNTRTTWECR